MEKLNGSASINIIEFVTKERGGREKVGGVDDSG